ncbi:hypothetical protein ACFW1P_04190 [Paenibacillus sp. NPDC058910]
MISSTAAERLEQLAKDIVELTKKIGSPLKAEGSSLRVTTVKASATLRKE